MILSGSMIGCSHVIPCRGTTVLPVPARSRSPSTPHVVSAALSVGTSGDERSTMPSPRTAPKAERPPREKLARRIPLLLDPLGVFAECARRDYPVQSG